MKKILIFFVVIIAILCTICYIYSMYKLQHQEKNVYNGYLESNLNKDISGTDLASLINKSANLNEQNDVFFFMRYIIIIGNFTQIIFICESEFYFVYTS